MNALLPSAASAGVEAEAMPVSGLNSELLLGLCFAHTFLDTMVDTWSVSDNEGRSRICLCLCDCFDCLIVISAHSDLCYVYIAIAHCDACHIFLLGFFTACCELCNCTGRSSFGVISACVGVNLGIEYHYVDIFSAGKYVVYAAESDIVKAHPSPPKIHWDFLAGSLCS